MRFRARQTSEQQGRVGPRWTASGWVTPGLIALVCIGLLIAAYERGHGHLHKITDVVAAPPPAEPAGPGGPGGQDAVRLSRTPSAVGTEPELLSAVFLPGRGMSLLQLTAAIPGHGELPLLAAPSLSDATHSLTGTGEDANGSLSATFGAALLLPWAGRLTGTPSGKGELQSSWKGKQLTFPAAPGNANGSTSGLFLARPAETVRTHVLPDGQSVDALFHADSFDGNWPSNADVLVHAELSGHSLDLTVTMKNTGSTEMPVGFGWKPYFALPAADRNNVLLTMPSSMVAEKEHRTGAPTGQISGTSGTAQDFVHARGTQLGGSSLDETYVDLQSGLMAEGPIAEIREPALNYGLRVIPLTSNFSNFHVVAPSNEAWISIAPASNANDPLGREWSGNPELGLQTLAPGASMQWKVRLELFSLIRSESTLP